MQTKYITKHPSCAKRYVQILVPKVPRYHRWDQKAHNWCQNSVESTKHQLCSSDFVNLVDCLGYFFWNRTTGSASRSLMSTVLPSLMTSGCFRTISHPIWAKKKPLLMLWGSASVSMNLWWARWSRHHSKMLFWKAIV